VLRVSLIILVFEEVPGVQKLERVVELGVGASEDS
jgi:hypothetical protein